jgi:hypothetical protein
MVIPPGPSHALRFSVVRYDLTVVGKLFVADGTFSVLLDNFTVQDPPHLRRRPELSISSRVMRIFDTPDAEPFPTLVPATAEERSVDCAVFISTEFHGKSPV